jgi:hypothetical protein
MMCGTQRGGGEAGTTTTVSPPVLPRAPVAPVSPVDPVAPVSPVDPVAPVPPADPVVPVDPVDPVAPVAPAGPGTATTAAGVTTVGLSHALNASAITTAENTIEYFMRIPFDCLTKTAHLDRFAATWSCRSKLPHIRVQFRSLTHITGIQVARCSRSKARCERKSRRRFPRNSLKMSFATGPAWGACGNMFPHLKHLLRGRSRMTGTALGLGEYEQSRWEGEGPAPFTVRSFCKGSYVCWRTELPERTGNNCAVPAGSFPP